MCREVPLCPSGPAVHRPARDFSADRGLDCGALKAKLWQSHGVRPLIEPRELWREERAMPGHDPARPITRALHPERADCIVYTEKGQVRCRCPSTGEERDLAFRGFDSGRNALKYRCPAAAHGFACEGRARGADALVVRPGPLGRHRLTGWLRPQVSPGPVPRARGRLVRVARTGAFCPCTNA